MGVALITGASSGLGLEFAKIFASNGHSLILVARRRGLLEREASLLIAEHEQIKVSVLELDLGVPGAGLQLFDKVRSQNLNVDFLVNNAGFGSTGAFEAQSLEKELQMMDLNMRTLVELTHLFLPAMIKRRSGRIMNIGSTAGFQPGPFMSTYYASKAFVNSFSESLHEELGGTGVTCTVFAPGATGTEFAKASGNAETRLFKSGFVARPKVVAKSGYRAMMSGRAIAVPGFLNNLMVQMLRVSPRIVSRKLAGFLNRPEN